MAAQVYPFRKNQWHNMAFLGVTALVGLIGTPLYIYEYGITGSQIALFTFFLAATPLGITVGYHRLFSHGTFKTNAVVRFVLLFFGAAAFEQSALQWSSQHRDHHRFVDTDRDPYSIKKGFFYAHLGWMLFWEHETNYGNAEDLQNDPLVMHQHRYYLWWAIAAGIGLPLLLGAISGHFLGALIMSVCLRIALVCHGTFFINSICHMFGKSTYDIDATAKDNWLIAFLTCGEGYHNFHHRFAGDYRNGVRWYQWDPSKWTIALLEKAGLAWNVRRISRFRILAAQFAGEHKRVSQTLIETNSDAESLKLGEVIKAQYDNLRSSLAKWEEASQEYGKILQLQVKQRSQSMRNVALQRMARTKEQFRLAHRNWNSLLEQCPAAG